MTSNLEMTLKQTSLSLSTGEKAEVSVALRNRGQTVDQFSLKIEGGDSTWYDLPVSSVALFPNDTDNLKIIISLPEKLKSDVTSQTLHILAVSQENPQDTVAADVVIQIKSAPRAEISLAPSRSSGRTGNYQISITNPGMTDLNMQLKPGDTAGKLKYTLQPDEITVPANNHSEVNLTARLKFWPYVFTGEKDFNFLVTALNRSTTPSEVCGTVSGFLLNEPWFKFLSKLRIPWLSRPPKILSFEAKTDDKREYTLSWVTKKGTFIKLDGANVEASGENVVNLAEDKEFTLVATNKYGTATKTLEVTPLPLPKARTLTRIKLTLSQSEIKAQAGGAPVPVDVQVQNLGEIVDKFVVEVEGLDDSWYTRSASSIALMPKTSDHVQILFKPPKKKGVKSGTYQFGVTVRSQSIAGEAATVLGQIEILPSVDFKIKVQPYRIESRKNGIFRVNLSNVNVTQTEIKLEATDLEENCFIEFDNERPILAPWNIIDVPMIVRPKKGRLVGEIRRFNITVTASTPDGLTQTANCDFSHKPLMKNWKWLIRLIKLIIVIAVIVLAIYFILKLGGGWDTFTRSPKTWINNAISVIEGLFAK